MQNIAYLLALHSINGLGPIRLKKMVDYFQDPKLAWYAGASQFKEIGLPQKVIEEVILQRPKIDPLKYLDSIAAQQIKWVTCFDGNYPSLLKEIYDPPTVLYYQGELPEGSKNIGVVGTRQLTSYGRMVTEKIAKELVLSGVTVVSGLARGVDAIAHKTVVENKGKTIAVLGGGLSNIFPPENIQLADKIIQGYGAIVTEYPPDYPALPGNFPARNRIISGLSLGIVVTEAAEDSGSLITAKLALEQGREVFAVPGQIFSQVSKGPHILIKLGAKLVAQTEDILEELGIDKQLSVKPPLNILSEDDQKVVNSIENEAKHIDEICRELKFPSSLVSACLVKLEIQGVVKNLGGGNYLKL